MLLARRVMGKFVYIASAVLMGTMLPLWAGGYLSVRGPVAIRIQAMPEPPSKRVVQAQLAAKPTPETTPASSENEPTDVAHPAVDEPIVVQAGGESKPSTPNHPAMPTEDLLTPQMLIPYF